MNQDIDVAVLLDANRALEQASEAQRHELEAVRQILGCVEGDSLLEVARRTVALHEDGIELTVKLTRELAMAEAWDMWWSNKFAAERMAHLGAVLGAVALAQAYGNGNIDYYWLLEKYDALEARARESEAASAAMRAKIEYYASRPDTRCGDEGCVTVLQLRNAALSPAPDTTSTVK